MVRMEVKDYIKQIIDEAFGESREESVRALIMKDPELSQNCGFQEISEWCGIMQRRVSDGTATGPEDILMQLLHFLSRNTKEKLREAVSKFYNRN